ncbi:hypothetical protein, partial [Gordonibacter sp. An230]|uniref:hypothetical protein n=1 Tax=Gordonibacter sp. An230 TaxID=1965592 RepID=UPI00194F7674
MTFVPLVAPCAGGLAWGPVDERASKIRAIASWDGDVGRLRSCGEAGGMAARAKPVPSPGEAGPAVRIPRAASPGEGTG